MSTQFVVKGTRLLKLAVEKENAYDYESALSYYSEGVQYLLKGVKCETDLKIQQSLKQNIEDYLQRAEKLKKLLEDRHKKLLEDRHNYVDKGSKLIKEAVYEDNNERFAEALQKYTLGIDILIKGLEYEQNKQIKNTVRQRIKQFSDRAQEIKKYLDSESNVQSNNAKHSQPIEIDSTKNNEEANRNQLRVYKKKAAIQTKHNWTTLLTVLMALFSSIGSIALTDSMGFESYTNGVIAISMSVCTLFIASIKIFVSWNAANMYLALNHGAIDKYEIEKDEISSQSLKMKAIAVLIATITDLTFDFLQGIAAIINEKYTDSVFYILVISTWIGVGDEIIECFVEIFFMSIQEIEHCHYIFCLVFLLWSVIESVMGCYLLNTYDSVELRIGGTLVECLIIVLSIVTIILLFRNGIK